MANLMKISSKQKAFWTQNYTYKFDKISSNYYLHAQASPYYDSNSKKERHLNYIQQKMKNSIKEFTSDNFFSQVSKTFGNYEEKTKNLAITFMAGTINDDNLQQQKAKEIINSSGADLIRKLNYYYKSFLENKKNNLRLEYTDGYADPSNNVKDTKLKRELENKLNSWIEKVYGSENFDYKSVNEALESILKNSESNTKEKLAKKIKQYTDTILKKIPEGEPKKVLQEWFNLKANVIINAFSRIKEGTNNNKKTDKKKINSEIFHIKTSTSQKDYFDIYKKLNMIYNDKQIGNEVEKDITNVLKGRRLKFQEGEIRLTAEHFGTSQINGRTRTTDIAVGTPTFEIDATTQKVVKTKQRQITNWSMKNSTPDKESEKYETHLRSMNGLENALDYLYLGLKGVNGIKLNSSVISLLQPDTPQSNQLKYFYVNESSNNLDGPFMTTLKDFLGSVGEFYQFAIGQKENQNKDQIDFMVINQNIVPSGFLWEKIIELYKINMMQQSYVVEITNKGYEGQSDSFGPYYKEEPPGNKDTKGKNLLSKIHIDIRMKKDFRTGIRNILKEVNNG